MTQGGRGSREFEKKMTKGTKGGSGDQENVISRVMCFWMNPSKVPKQIHFCHLYLATKARNIAKLLGWD